MNSNDYLANLLGAFATTISTRIEQQIADLGGRSLNHEAALVAIRNHPDDSIDVLSKVLALTHSGTVRLINTLEEEGLVERHRNEKDARSAVLRVTRKGRNRADKVVQARKLVTAQILEGLNANQQESLAAVLEEVLDGQTGDLESARRICRLCDEKVCRTQGCPVEEGIAV